MFVSHGSPMLLLEPGRAGPAWQAVAASRPRPRAILAVSAHWTTHIPAVSAAPQPQTIHDFYGFPPALYAMSYRPPGAVELAAEVKRLLPQVAVDAGRGLDHGAWAPLHYMYPQADIPVVQLAVMPGQSPQMHYQLGAVLRELTSAGVLVLASGGLTHNLGDLLPQAADDEAVAAYAEFRDWFAAALERRDLAALFDYRQQAPHAARAHPSEEHLLPLYVALGAAGDDYTLQTPHRGWTLGTLAMDAFVFA